MAEDKREENTAQVHEEALGWNRLIDKVAKRKTEKLEAESLTDQLTGLPNRRAFDERLGVEIARKSRRLYEDQSEPLCLVMLDLDGFKQVNDQRGHPEGDKVLKRFAELATQVLKRKTDFVARVGGDEFAFILPDADEEGAFIFMGRLQKQAEELLKKYKIGFSVGIREWNGESAAELYHGADQKLLAAKELKKSSGQGAKR
jgi:diguanylate cyclase